MTTLITRVFPDASVAESAANKLIMKGFPKRDLQIIAAGDKAEAMMHKAQVHETAVPVYDKCLAQGNAVLVVKATYRPLGVARLTRDILAKFDTIDTGKAVDDFTLAWAPERATSVLKDHPLMLSLPDRAPPGRNATSFGKSVLTNYKTKRSLISSDKRISRMFWPMSLVSKKKNKRSVIKGGRQMSKMFWPAPLISKKPRRKSVIPGGGFPFSRRIGMKTLS